MWSVNETDIDDAVQSVLHGSNSHHKVSRQSSQMVRLLSETVDGEKYLAAEVLKSVAAGREVKWKARTASA